MGYTEVQKWLKGERVAVFFKEVDINYRRFVWGNEGGSQLVANNPIEVSELMKQYPSRGKAHLYRQTICNWLKDDNPGLYVDLLDVVETELPGSSEAEKDACLQKAIYLLNPEHPFEAFDGTVLLNADDFAQHFTLHFDHYLTEFANPYARFFLYLDTHDQKAEAKQFRTLFTAFSPTKGLNSLILSLEGGNRFVFGKYELFQAEELVHLPINEQARLIQDLTQADSKLSIWLNSFPVLADSIRIWRQEGRYDVESFRYAIKEGFSFGGMVARNPQAFQGLLVSQVDHITQYDPSRHSLQDLTSFEQNEINDELGEADYWLKTYQESSIIPIIQEVLSQYVLKGDSFLPLFYYLLCEKPITTLHDLLPKLKEYGESDQAIFNALVKLTAEAIKRYAAQENIFKVNQALIKLSEADKRKYPAFYDDLFQELSPLFDLGIQQGIHSLSGPFSDRFTYLINDIEAFFNDLKQQGYQLDCQQKHEKVIEVITKRAKKEGREIMNQKNKKLQSLNNRFQQVLDRQISTTLANNKKKIRNSILTKLALAILMLFLLFIGIYLFFDYSDGSEIASTVGGILGLVGVIGGIVIGIGSVDDGNLIGAIILAIAGWWIGKFIGSLIGITIFQLFYWSSQVWLLQLASIGGFVFFVHSLTQINNNIDQSVSTIRLTPNDQMAFDQGLQLIDKAERDAVVEHRFHTIVETLQMTIDELEKA